MKYTKHTAEKPASLRPLARALAGLALIAGIASCTVSESYIVRSYEFDEGRRVKRIVQATLAAPAVSSAPDAAVFEMFQGVAREFISHHHEYIVLGGEALPADAFADIPDGLPGATTIAERPPKRAFPGAAVDRICQADYDGKATHGVLLSQFQRLDLAGNSVQLQVESRLIDCETGLLVWRAVGANSYATEDGDLEQTIRGYANRYGEGTRPYVAGFFLLARKLFESMPDPTLSEDDIIEKIEIDSLVE